MGFFDSIRERFSRRDAYEDDYYEDYDYDDEDYDGDDYDDGYHSILGNTPRPKVESVSVYTRSGQLVSTNSIDEDLAAPAPYERNSNVRDDANWTDSRLDYTPSESSHYGPQASVSVASPEVVATRRYSGRLPAYVLRPTTYEDVQTVVRRVSTNQPVVIAFRQTPLDTAKRIVDFSLGFACGVGGCVQELDELVYVVLPAAVELTDNDLAKLAKDGVIRGDGE